ncbi:MAG: T9SS type A sorting domain-containing protein, partial [Saprospiraceae bacterium]|nr:T9SS type A sorting domain-containing protein [Saprospiraceae bacterium]
TPQEGVAMQYDFRSVYATLLVDWLGAKDTDIKTVLFDDFAKLPLIQGCIPDDVKEVDKSSEIQVFPNPCTSETTLRFTLDAKAHIHIAVYDALGSMIRLITDKSLDGGDHSIKIDTTSLVSGAYHIRMQQNHMVQTLRFIKV